MAIIEVIAAMARRASQRVASDAQRAVRRRASRGHATSLRLIDVCLASLDFPAFVAVMMPFDIFARQRLLTIFFTISLRFEEMPQSGVFYCRRREMRVTLMLMLPQRHALARDAATQRRTQRRGDRAMSTSAAPRCRHAAAFDGMSATAFMRILSAFAAPR